MNKKRPAKARGRAKAILWVTDPWDTLDHARDTTLRLAQECLKQGARAAWCDVHSIRFESGTVVVDAQELLQIGDSRAPAEIIRAEQEATPIGAFHSVHYRTDPPVDLAYIHALQLLVHGAGRRVPIINPPGILLTSSEKLEGAFAPGLIPATLAATQWETLRRFGREEGRAVLKPLHLAQSKGVELLDLRTPEGEARARGALEKATEGFTRPALLQRYLEGIKDGEQRLWFLDGKLLACVRKLPLSGDFRVNIDGGSRIVPTRLTRAEATVAAKISAHLRRQKIRLAAVDLIEAKITDFNFTSPGLITGMESVLKTDLARPIVRALLKRL